MIIRLDTKTPLSVGKIVGTGWKLYTGNFLQFTVISLRAAAWMFAPFLVATVAVWMLTEQGMTTLGELDGLMALAIPAWLVFYLFCAANSLGESAAISRLAYQLLNQRKLPSTVDSAVTNSHVGLTELENSEQALRFTRSRKFSLLGSAAIRFVVGALISFVFVFLFLLSSSLMIAAAGIPPQSGTQMNIGLFVTGLLLSFAVVVVSIAVSIFVNMRMAIAEQSLAIEQESGALSSIGRSWKLMKKNVLKTFGVLFLVALISFPVSLILSAMTQGATSTLFDLEAAVEADPGRLPLLMFAGLYFVNLLLGTIASIIVMPFFKTILTTVYFDARHRTRQVIDSLSQKEEVEV